LDSSNKNIFEVIDLFEYKCDLDEYNAFIKDYKSKFDMEIMAKNQF